MDTPLTPTPLQVVGTDPARVDAEWLVVPIFEQEDSREWMSTGDGLGREVERALRPGDFRGKRFESIAVAPADSTVRPRRMLLLGAGSIGEYEPEIARRLAAASVILARERRVPTLAFVHRLPAGLPGGRSVGEWIRAESEGLTLGEFDAGLYKTGKDDRRPNPSLAIVVPGTGDAALAALQGAADRARQVAHCTNIARELINEPGNLLPPRVLAERARELAAGTCLGVDVLDDRQLADLGMGLVLGVGQGSRERPRLIVLSHTPPNAPDAPVLGIVGKGVTFDSGGISIKSADGMERMKDDMAGGAAVLLAMRAISLLDAPIRVVGVVPAVENMPGGAAIRPGDVLRGASGRTVEVINTDAEGRLILGDAVWFAQRMGATHVVDIATLTGACMVALGKTTTGVFGWPDDWRERVLEVCNRCGERAWPLPVFDDYKDLLKSEIADTRNSGGRYAGAITAAMFVGEFARGVAWAHLDVAGTAWNDEWSPYQPKGPTGVGVRTLVDLAFTVR
jgi:leucyl aminopeptidase